MLLAGQKVVVVGGSSGIGLSTAELAKTEGADVIIASRNPDRLKTAAAQLGAKAIPTNVTSDESVSQLFRQCGPVDHVVVTAAQLRTGPFKEVPMENVRATMEGKFWGARRVARAAEIRAGGSLTLVSGFLSVRPRPAAAIVGAVNGALESLGRSLALELAPVRVNVVSPVSTHRSGPLCRRRLAARCWPKRLPRCRLVASGWVKILRGRFSLS